MPTLNNAKWRREYWGATATSLPVIGGTILIEELRAGRIPHALALSIPQPRDTYVWPAQRSDGDPAGIIPAGTRFRLQPDVVIDPSWPPLLKMTVEAARDYGIVVRDRTHSIVTFYAEDPRPYGSDPYPCFYGGMELEKVLALFPFEKLVALKSAGPARRYARESRMDNGTLKDWRASELKRERADLLAAEKTLRSDQTDEGKALRALLASGVVGLETEMILRGLLRPEKRTGLSWEVPDENRELEALQRVRKRFQQAPAVSSSDRLAAELVDRRLYFLKIKASGVWDNPPKLPVSPDC